MISCTCKRELHEFIKERKQSDTSAAEAHFGGKYTLEELYSAAISLKRQGVISGYSGSLSVDGDESFGKVFHFTYIAKG